MVINEENKNTWMERRLRRKLATLTGKLEDGSRG